MKRRVDDVDRRIIELLRENSRMRFVEIAERIGISEASVRRRIKALVDSGVIRRFTVEAELEHGLQAVVFVATDPSRVTGAVAEEALRLDGVEAVYEVTGEYDVAIVVRVPSVSKLNSCIDDIRRIEGVVKTNTVIILRVWR